MAFYCVLSLRVETADDELDRRKLANRIPPSQAHAEDAEE